MNKIFLIIVLSFSLISSIRLNGQTVGAANQSRSVVRPAMYFSDSTDTGVFLAKDPVVVNFKGRYLMYYSRKMRYDKADGMQGWGIGIAESSDLTNWKKIAEINPAAEYEKKGLCAPGALIRDGKVQLFYQTYGNGPKDAICHAASTDGINFVRDESNPVFRPTGDWNNGRAIDAEVYRYNNKFFLYFATRDPAGKIQKQGVAVAAGKTNFSKAEWKQAVDSSILQPYLDWEGECVEGASVIKKNNKLYMFYAGSYNNAPQQIGVAASKDGVTWKRLYDQPFLANGKPGSWNSSESGHPCIFEDRDGKTYLFYQGNNDKGRTWYLSRLQIGWNNEGPYIIQ
jgi:predicted GH43/DUF377 family glycosyl hydrolase